LVINKEFPQLVASTSNNNEKTRENSRNVNLVSEHRLCGSQPEPAMDRVDWLRTSAGERVLSGRCAVVMV